MTPDTVIDLGRNALTSSSAAGCADAGNCLARRSCRRTVSGGNANSGTDVEFYTKAVINSDSIDCYGTVDATNLSGLHNGSHC